MSLFLESGYSNDIRITPCRTAKPSLFSVSGLTQCTNCVQTERSAVRLHALRRALKTVLVLHSALDLFAFFACVGLFFTTCCMVLYKNWVMQGDCLSKRYTALTV